MAGQPKAGRNAHPGLKGVSQLYGRHPGSDIFVVGTGPSLRVFPVELLAGRVTIGLNMAWKLVDVDYAITVHPELNIPELMEGEHARPSITWVTKHEKLGNLTAEQIAYAEERFYFFRTDGKKNTSTTAQSNAGQVPQWLARPTGEFLYLLSSISQPAVNLAANMGARNIVLVGCDNAALFGNHHAHDQHTSWLGERPEDRYREYYRGLAEARTVLRERGVNLVSMGPFLTLGPHEEEFVALCHELGRPELIPNHDRPAPPRRAPLTPVQRAKGKARAAARRLAGGRR
ncbi:MAG: hypothetical protein AB1673_14130 [Actinomycetota bacterium]|jgi:hypothetical protein